MPPLLVTPAAFVCASKLNVQIDLRSTAPPLPASLQLCAYGWAALSRSLVIASKRARRAGSSSFEVVDERREAPRLRADDAVDAIVVVPRVRARRGVLRVVGDRAADVEVVPRVEVDREGVPDDYVEVLAVVRPVGAVELRRRGAEERRRVVARCQRRQRRQDRRGRRRSRAG